MMPHFRVFLVIVMIILRKSSTYLACVACFYVQMNFIDTITLLYSDRIMNMLSIQNGEVYCSEVMLKIPFFVSLIGLRTKFADFPVPSGTINRPFFQYSRSPQYLKQYQGFPFILL